jgi:membrane-associated phospholipid phosphatase
LLHPLFLFNYGVIWLLSGEPGEEKYVWMGLSLLFCFFIPALIVWLIARDIHISRQEKRQKPLLLSLLSFGIFVVLGHLYNHTHIKLGGLTLTVMADIFLVGIISARYKISMHATGFGLFLVALFVFFFTSGKPLWLLIPIIGLILIVIWQRVSSGAHTWPQIAAGLALGAASMGCFLLLSLYL